MAKKPEIDNVTGVDTTGHEWDGIKELNNPLPKWWVWTWYACIAWALGYMVVYPAWPTLTGYTKGVIGYSQRQLVADNLAAAKAAQTKFIDAVATKSLEEIQQNPELLRFALAGGKASFKDNCAPCHGRGAEGRTGYPNLNDDDWIWGGTPSAIYETIKFGIRSTHDDTRLSDMPKFGPDEILEATQISDVANYVLSLSGENNDAEAAKRGDAIFKENCASCHADDGAGMAALGAPNLKDALWLYGSSKEAVTVSIKTGRGGVMPHWTGRLDDTTIKELTLYVHSLGGGQ